MNDVKFDLNSIYFLQKSSRQIEGRVSDSSHSFDKLCSAAREEATRFSDDCCREASKVRDGIVKLQAQIREIELQKNGAIDKKRDELQCPTPPDICTDDNEERKDAVMAAYRESVSEIDEQNAKIRDENEQIDSYAKKCDEAIAEINEIIVKLKAIEESIRRESDEIRSCADAFNSKVYDIKNRNRFTVSACASFNYALTKAYEMAERIETFDTYSLSSGYDIPRQFVIRNTHSHISDTGIVSSGISFTTPSSSTEDTLQITSEQDVQNGEITVNEKKAEAFFDKISGHDKIQMPSGNVRFLGGKAFHAKMKELGYQLAVQKDGTIIDKNRMIHWEKI